MMMEQRHHHGLHQQQGSETVSSMLRSILRNLFFCLLAPCFLLTIRSWKTATGRVPRHIQKQNILFASLSSSQTSLLDLPPVPVPNLEQKGSAREQEKEDVLEFFDHQPSSNRTSGTPTLWVFVGPPKTGTNALEMALEMWMAKSAGRRRNVLFMRTKEADDAGGSASGSFSSLRQSNSGRKQLIHHQSRIWRTLIDSSCHKQLLQRREGDHEISFGSSAFDCWTPVVRQFRRWETQGIKHVFVVDTRLSTTSSPPSLDWVSLFAGTTQWQVRALVGYRPYVDWWPRIQNIKHQPGFSFGTSSAFGADVTALLPKSLTETTSSVASSVLRNPTISRHYHRAARKITPWWWSWWKERRNGSDRSADEAPADQLQSQSNLPFLFTDDLIRRIQPFVASVDIVAHGSPNETLSTLECLVTARATKAKPSLCQKRRFGEPRTQFQRNGNSRYSNYHAYKRILAAAFQLGWLSPPPSPNFHELQIQEIQRFHRTLLRNRTLTPINCLYRTAQDWQNVWHDAYRKDQEVWQLVTGIAPTPRVQPGVPPPPPPKEYPWCPLDAVRLLQADPLWEAFVKASLRT